MYVKYVYILSYNNNDDMIGQFAKHKRRSNNICCWHVNYEWAAKQYSCNFNKPKNHIIEGIIELLVRYHHTYNII